MLVSVCAELPQLIAAAGDGSEKSLCAPGMPWPRLPVSGRMQAVGNILRVWALRNVGSIPVCR